MPSRRLNQQDAAARGGEDGYENTFCIWPSTSSILAGFSVPIFLRINMACIVNILVSRTTDFFGSFPCKKSVSESAMLCSSSVRCDVIAARIKSWVNRFTESGEMIRAGRCLVAVRSVKGKGKQGQRRPAYRLS